MAPCDGPNMIPVDQLADVITQLRAFDALTKGL
jgi:2-dehydro-3-deoxyphosphooctonate aldolase (KDO 8-P synthase)